MNSMVTWKQLGAILAALVAVGALFTTVHTLAVVPAILREADERYVSRDELALVLRLLEQQGDQLNRIEARVNGK